MRSALGMFGSIGGAVVVAMAALYGFTTSDTALSGIVVGFFFSIIALGAIGGPAVAVHLGARLDGWAKLWVIPVVMVVLCAILGNMSSSLGALVSRSDKGIAERTKASDATKDHRAELARLTRERAAMAFTPATEDAAKTAREAVAAAERVRAAECVNGDTRQRGPNCRLREAEEFAKRDALMAVLANKAATDKAAQLDADAARVRSRLDTAPPIASANPLADALARILQMPAADASTWRDFFLVAVAELLIAGALASFEALSPTTSGSPAVPTNSMPSVVAPTEQGLPADITRNVGPAIGHEGAPAPEGDVGKFMLSCVQRATGTTVTWTELYVRYLRWCGEQSLLPVRPQPFGAELDLLRSDGVIRTRVKGQDVHCLDIRLAA